MLHQKIKDLQKRIGSTPIQKSTLEINQRGALVDASNPRLIKAYHCVWGVPDDYGTVWVKGSWTRSIQERGPNSGAKNKIIVIRMHDQTVPLCVPNVLKEDDYGVYSEWEPDAIAVGDDIVTQVRSGTINQFSFGFNYLWDKMVYDDKSGNIIINEAEIIELSPVTFGSQIETYAVRSSQQIEEDTAALILDTEKFMLHVPRREQLSLRNLIDRHISLAKTKPLDIREKAQGDKKIEPTEAGLDYSYLSNHLKIKS